MAHNLFGNRVVLARVPAWHNLGIVFQGKKTLKDVFELSGCNFPITVVDIPLTTVDGMVVDTSARKMIIRHPTLDDPQPVLLEVVSEDYKLVTNQELVDWYNGLSEVFPVETMGALGRGETFFFTLDAGEVEVGGKDPVHNFFLVTDNKTGYQKTRIAFTPVRVVCQNTLTSGLASATIDVSIGHKGENKKQLMEIARITKEMKRRADEVNKLFNIMGNSRISKEEFERIIKEEIYPLNPGEEEYIVPADMEGFSVLDFSIPKAQREQVEVMNLFNQYNDTLPANLQGTRWAAWNAVTEWEDWKNGKGNSQFTSSLFGKRKDTKVAAFNLLTQGLK